MGFSNDRMTCDEPHTRITSIDRLPALKSTRRLFNGNYCLYIYKRIIYDYIEFNIKLQKLFSPPVFIFSKTEPTRYFLLRALNIGITDHLLKT